MWGAQHGALALEIGQYAAQDLAQEGVVEVNDQGCLRVGDGGGVLLEDDGVGEAEQRGVGAGYRAEGGGELDAEEMCEGERGGDEEATAFAAAEIDEVVPGGIWMRARAWVRVEGEMA